MGTFILPAVRAAGLLLLLLSFRGRIAAGVEDVALVLPISFAPASGIVATVYLCAALLLSGYVSWQLQGGRS